MAKELFERFGVVKKYYDPDLRNYPNVKQTKCFFIIPNDAVLERC